MMQHQYWVTKKTVLKKLGTKEDECIVASDAELDAKLELFRSISDSCLQLQRVLDQYQERLCILAQEENSLGKFLRDAGKSTDASAKHMVSAGKAVSYSGQQRLSVRPPLLRLYHEVETFRCRAVKDMRATVSAMEKARIEYRAALSWMKSTSAQLDPDTGRGLDSFRKAQRQVRESKKAFDKLTLDVLQKIDLLAAARCNMFSHVLSNYQSSFLNFATKVAQTLEATVDTMNETPQYEFCILKSLGEVDPNQEEGSVPDKDQMLFFQDEYKDEQPKPESKDDIEKQPSDSNNQEEPGTSSNLINTKTEIPPAGNNISSDLAGISLDCGDLPANFGNFMPSQLLENMNTMNLLEESMTPIHANNIRLPSQSANQPQQQAVPKPAPKKEDKAAWFKLFAELDPLANPDNLLGFLRGFLSIEDPPNKVLEVRSDNYISRPIHYREDSMLLYGPKIDGKSSKDKYYEIVLHKPYTESLNVMYSLFRSENRETCEERFIVFKERIPLYIKITKECTVAGLQKICDTLTEHRSWSVAHLVAHFGQHELFNDPDVQKQINEVDPATGTTPLMVAVKSGNVRMVHTLVTLKCNLDFVDIEGNTVFHYAAASNKEIINVLAGQTTASLNLYNKQGYTPLHMACLADAPDCVRALILAGADVNLTAAEKRTMLSASYTIPGIVGDVLQDNQPKLFQQDMKRGGTPLHWAVSREVIEALVDKNCDINALNFDARTALHIMVLRGRLECAIALLSRGAEHSTGDNEGNTPLHLAVKQTNIAIVQALVVFGADLEKRNNAGFTARHIVPTDMSNSNYDKILYILHSVGAQRCTSDIPGCGSGCSARGEYNGVPPPAVARAATREQISDMLTSATMAKASTLETSEKQGRLLCLDGGGIRGLVLIQLLLNLEAVVGKPIVHCFDWVAGTSTGGILALALACGKSLRECQRLYFRMKEFAFVGMRPYPSESLETILKECLGTETVMADIDHPKLMILAVLADRKPVDLHIFRNYQSAQEILNNYNGTSSPHAEAGDNTTVVSLPSPPPPAEQLVWQAARATGAAPSYFRASGRYLDGGLMGNNPTLDALTELAELRLALEATGQHDKAKKTYLKVVVSCGTGLIPVTKLKDIDVFKPESLWDTARLALGLTAIGSLLVDQATQSDGRVVERARAWCSALGVPYYRFAPQMSRDVAMDEKSDERLVTMLWEAHAYMRSNRDRLAELAAILRDNSDEIRK
ncbi:85/88 kDa calcium-independent phospholipase A2 [Maniola jurtina]|uniref:85/88 kDa calcium-independent phospholipase A2 n=1 Tax=Maniola jurtina TaxID=191418 RepID=UPI001E68BF73|nr:85/88 kDa calcium-independent phospholipase A2 [Maniola jurtina]